MPKRIPYFAKKKKKKSIKTVRHSQLEKDKPWLSPKAVARGSGISLLERKCYTFCCLCLFLRYILLYPVHFIFCSSFLELFFWRPWNPQSGNHNNFLFFSYSNFHTAQMPLTVFPSPNPLPFLLWVGFHLISLLIHPCSLLHFKSTIAFHKSVGLGWHDKAGSREGAGKERGREERELFLL